MAFSTLPPLPDQIDPFMDWPWDKIQPYFDDLTNRTLTAGTVGAWLADWTRLAELLSERGSWLAIDKQLDTTDKVAEQRFFDFIEHIEPPQRIAEQRLKEKLLASGLEPAGFEVPLRNMRSDAALFCEENIPLFTELQKIGTEYDKLRAAQVVMWEGAELNVAALRPYLASPDRAVREKAWRAVAERQLQDRAAMNGMWQQLLERRLKIARNAGFDSFRDYQWRALYRFDYTPDDAMQFHAAIEQTVVPAVKRLVERTRQAMKLDTIRPWDIDGSWGNYAPIDPYNRAPLKPFSAVSELESGAARIFTAVDAELGEQFESLRRGNLLNLANKKGKGPGAWCQSLNRQRRPFLFMSAVGLHDDLQTLLHEAGHGFHVFESADLPYIQHLDYTSEIAEVASMSMELLAMPYLTKDKGGFYSMPEANRARSEHLEGMLLFWPYMAVVDAFQHWVYTHADDAMNPANCDARWGELWDRFMGFHDWSSLEDVKVTGWHRKLHIFQAPFYYLEYGVAQLGAAQIWRNSLRDQAGAVAAYRRALALGGSRPLPELFGAAGAKLAFDAGTLGEAVTLIEQKLGEMHAQ